MAFRGLKVLAVIPARGGSKGIPRKNLQLVGGVSLVGRAAQVVERLAWIDRVVLSTDDPEIAAHGQDAGLEVPFLRPAELSQDSSKSVDMWRQVWLACEERDGCRYDVSVLLEPTSPMRRAEDVERTIETLLSGTYAAAATVSPNPAHFTPHKTLTVNGDGTIGFYLPDGARYARRQDIPQYYHRNGICYAAHRATVIDRGEIIEHCCIGVVMERPVVNIDEPIDLEFTEFLLARGF